MSKVSIVADAEKKHIKLIFPLTAPTSKVRIKKIVNRDPILGEPPGKLVDTKRYSDLKDCYIEWQISYYSQNENEVKDILDSNSSFLKRIDINKLKIEEKNYFLHELSLIILFGLLLKIFSKEDLEEIYRFIETIRKENIFLEEKKISRVEDFTNLYTKRIDFNLFYEKTPLYLYKEQRDKSDFDFFIEIILKHKQRAVGYQSMIFLCIPLQKCFLYSKENKEERITNIEEKIRSRSTCYLYINKNNKNIILKTIEAFAIASKTHNKDIEEILKHISRVC